MMTSILTQEKAVLLKGKLLEYAQMIRVVEQSGVDADTIASELYQDLYSKALVVVYGAHELLSGKSDLLAEEKQQIADLMREYILPYLLQTGTASRFYTKPLGYAGDYLALENIYQNVPTGSSAIGRIVDRMHLEARTSVVVRNRRRLIADRLLGLYYQHPDKGMNVMCIASGSAREIFDLYNTVPATAQVHTTLLDFDGEALRFCEQWRDEMGWQSRISLVQETILNLMVGRSKVKIPLQDVVYSIGIIDYFQEKPIVRLLNYIHSILKPGGKVILGNFHVVNNFKEYMDEVLNWKLIHRTEAEMQKMLLASHFKKTGEVFFEPEGLNMFIQASK